MNCKTAEKFLHLFKDDELTISEKSQLKEHLLACSTCMELHHELNGFEETLHEFGKFNPILTNPEQLTNNIMNSISSDNQGTSETVFSLFHIPAIRIAASLLIIVQVAAFLFQQNYISGSISLLNEKIHSVNSRENTDLEASNTECIEQSKSIIADLFGKGNPGLKRKAIAFGRNLSKAEIEACAVQICRYSYHIQKTGNKKQKQALLINIISNELNIKL